jgi:hypothetical protein
LRRSFAGVSLGKMKVEIEGFQIRIAYGGAMKKDSSASIDLLGAITSLSSLFTLIELTRW